jgi:6-phosphogluconolactonase
VIRALFSIFLFAVVAVSGGYASDFTAYIGTYTGPGSKGIYTFRFDSESGKLTGLNLAVESSNPSFLAVHPNGRYLYAANENQDGSISAFAIEAGRLRFINTVPSRGAAPCHIALDRTGRWLFAANYAGGSVAAFPVRGDGGLGEASAFVQHTGSGIDPQRQSGPHAHMVVPSPDNRFLLVADLGLDEVLVYGFDAAKGTLMRAGAAKLPPGSGPRHLAFSRNGRFVFVLNELTAAVNTLVWDAKRGRLDPVGSTSGFSPASGAEIAVHPNGRFLYTSNRGDSSIAVFRIRGGKLTLVGNVASGGKTPRSFCIDPSGKFLLVANQASGDIAAFRIDSTTGLLKAAGEPVAVPTPVSIVFADSGTERKLGGKAEAMPYITGGRAALR